MLRWQKLIGEYSTVSDDADRLLIAARNPLCCLVGNNPFFGGFPLSYHGQHRPKNSVGRLRKHTGNVVLLELY